MRSLCFISINHSTRLVFAHAPRRVWKCLIISFIRLSWNWPRIVKRSLLYHHFVLHFFDFLLKLNSSYPLSKSSYTSNFIRFIEAFVLFTIFRRFTLEITLSALKYFLQRCFILANYIFAPLILNRPGFIQSLRQWQSCNARINNLPLIPFLFCTLSHIINFSYYIQRSFP